MCPIHATSKTTDKEGAPATGGKLSIELSEDSIKLS